LTQEIVFLKLSKNAKTIGKERNLKKYLILFLANILLMLILSGVQFFLRPQKIWAGFNLIDIFFIFYLLFVLMVSFILPRGKLRFKAVWQNISYFSIHLFLLPVSAAAQICREFEQRFAKSDRSLGKKINNLAQSWFKSIWRKLFGKSNDNIFFKNPGAYVSVNRLIEDLPYLGLIFMGLVIGLVILILKIGDNPLTPALDGFLVLGIKNIFQTLTHLAGNRGLIIITLVSLSVFVTEFVSNTTVLLVMTPLVLSLASTFNLNPLMTLLAVVIGSSAAFMTPIATSVNAVVYGGMKRVSLKQMLFSGLFLNVLSILFISLVFNFLI
jgi:hypothetical protein